MPIRRKVRIAPTKEIIGEPVLQIGVLGIGTGWSGYWFRPESFQREPIMKDNVKIETTPAGEPPWAEGLKRIYSAVLEEPMPEIFEKLLEELGKTDNDNKK